MNVPASEIMLPPFLAGSAFTGSTTKTALATITIPAGIMGPNDVAEVEWLCSYTNNANNKTFDVDFGATNFHSQVTATNACNSQKKFIFNRNSITSQVSSAINVSYGAVAASLVTMSENTANSIAVKFSVTLASAADSATLERFSVNIIKALT